MSLQNANDAVNMQATKGNELPGDESEVPNSPTGTFVCLDNNEKFPSKLLIEEEVVDREEKKTKKRNSTDSNASLAPRNDMYDTEILTNTNSFHHRREPTNVMLLSNLSQIQDSVCELFAEGDKDKDGVIKREEFFHVMQKILPESTYSELDELFDRLDIKKVGGIDYEQLLHSTEGGNFLKSTLGLEDDNTSITAMSPRKLVNFTSFNMHSGGKPHSHHHAHNNSSSSVVIKQSTPVNAKKRDSLESHDSLVIDMEYDNMSVSHHPKDLQLIQQLKLQIEGVREENKTLKKLEKEVRDLKEEMDIFKSNHQRLEYEFDDLKKELETTQTERNDLQHQNERLEQHCKQLKHELEDVTEQAPNEEERLEQINKLETTVVELRRNTVTLSEQEKSIKNEITTQQKYIETLEFKNSQLQEQVVAMETKLSDQNDASEGLQVELRRTQDFLHKRMRSAMYLKREVLELQNELETQSPLNSETEQPQKPKEADTIRLRVKHISGKLSQEALKLAKESKKQNNLDEKEELDDPPDLLVQLSQYDSEPDNEHAREEGNETEIEHDQDDKKEYEDKLEELEQKHTQEINALKQQFQLELEQKLAEKKEERAKWMKETKEKLMQEIKLKRSDSEISAHEVSVSSSADLRKPLLNKSKETESGFRLSCVLCGLRCW